MICRFCGNKTDNIEKCDHCFEKNVVLLEYRSIHDNFVMQKLSSLFDLPDDENNNIEQSSEAADSKNQVNQQTLNETRKIAKNMKYAWIISSTAVVFVGVICFLVGMRCGTAKLSEDADIMSETVTPTISSEIEEITDLQVVETESDSETKENFKISGKYYAISNSDYAENNGKLLINIFGYQPATCSKVLLISDDAVSYDAETRKIDSESTIYQELDESFITNFDFQKIIKNSDVDDTNEELYIFQVKNSKVDAVILCNELNGLSYGEIDKTKNDSEGECIFSITDNEGKSPVSLYENTSHKVFLQNETAVSNVGNGDIIIDLKNKYKIIRLSIGGKYYYFYQKYDVSTVYMIQYIKYNTAENVGET